MSTPLVTQSSTMMCPHGGVVHLTQPTVRIKASGIPAMTIGEALVTGCALPNPCIKVAFTGAALRARASGQPLLNMASSGQCVAADGTVNGAVVVTTGDPRVTVS